LHRRAHLAARPEQRAQNRSIDVCIGCNRFEVWRRIAPVARRGGRRAHDQRADPRERRRDRVGQAERKKIDLRVRAQHPERQHDDPRQRLGENRALVTADGGRVLQLVGHRRGRRRSIRRPLGQRTTDQTVDRRHSRSAGQRWRLLGHRRAKNLGNVAAGERRPPGQHLEQQHPGGE